ncbi:hypothetical protein JZ751_004041 [Albula glossodonta]|uniref:Uncharacterized protein n=1 Tax=Albula glossodonta TaxID=121402 RepID=A0A8T2P9X7_9TELE|nr:hypothetical protein JZ751_004041 [Albula glossodonta]
MRWKEDVHKVDSSSESNTIIDGVVIDGIAMHAVFCSAGRRLLIGGSLLINALNCADKGTDEHREDCGSRVALADEPTALRPLAPSGALRELGHVQPITWKPEESKKPSTSREKRQLEGEKSHYPGITSVSGQPMRLMMQTERSRRHLPAHKKKPKRKSRVGSFSLLSHKQPTALQVTRVRRQLQNNKRKQKAGRTGKFSALGNSGPTQAQRSKRNLHSKKKNTKKTVCS